MASRLVERFGEELGIAYQILDDIYDATGGPPSVGKEQGMDLDKPNFVELFGVDESFRRALHFKARALVSCNRDL